MKHKVRAQDHKTLNIRLRFIEAMFIQHGCVHRQHVSETFGTKKHCTARSLNAYSKMNTGVAYSQTHLTWMTRRFFQPTGILTVPAGDYLHMVSQLFEAPDFSKPGSVQPKIMPNLAGRKRRKEVV